MFSARGEVVVGGGRELLVEKVPRNGRPTTHTMVQREHDKGSVPALITAYSRSDLTMLPNSTPV